MAAHVAGCKADCLYNTPSLKFASYYTKISIADRLYMHKKLSQLEQFLRWNMQVMWPECKSHSFSKGVC